MYKPRFIIPPTVAYSSIAYGCGCRLVKRAKGLVGEQVRSAEQTCRSRLRSAKRVAQQLHRQVRRKGEDKEAEQKQLYQKLVEIAEHMVQQASGVVAALGQQTQRQAKRLRTQVEALLPPVKQVIAQTRRRVLEGKKVPSDQKVLSLFEPHTRAIPRHKGGALVEFGRHVILDEVEGGIVTRYQILEHPNEHGQATRAVAHHVALFDHPPGTVAGDRGVHSPETEAALAAAGVKRVAIPASGKLSEERKALEHTRRGLRGYRWRAGIEGRIASLRRDYGWRMCRYHGQDGMERWLGLGVMGSRSAPYRPSHCQIKLNKRKAQQFLMLLLNLHRLLRLLEHFAPHTSTKYIQLTFLALEPMTDKMFCGHWLKRSKQSWAASSSACFVSKSSQWVTSRRKWRHNISMGLSQGL